MGYLFLMIMAALLVGAGYFLGLQRGKSREAAVRTSLDDRIEKLTIAEHELLHRASMDPVTGLHTQQYFQEFLAREWRRASRDLRAVSVMMIEIDHFQSYSDRQGKPEGDACLIAVAHVLNATINRPGDLLALYGGTGRFGAVLGGTDTDPARALAERMRAGVEGLKWPNPDSSTAQIATISIGLAAATPHKDATWQDVELIAAAERALVHAREAGRNVVGTEAGVVSAGPV